MLGLSVPQSNAEGTSGCQQGFHDSKCTALSLNPSRRQKKESVLLLLKTVTAFSTSKPQMEPVAQIRSPGDNSVD